MEQLDVLHDRLARAWKSTCIILICNDMLRISW